MDCDRILEALSARLDGEDPGLSAPMIDEHLAGCPSCAAWLASSADLRRRSHLSVGLDVPDQTAAILARAGQDRRASELRPWQGALVAVGVLQLVLSLPGLLLGADLGGASAHAAHELRSWDAALAVGFLFAAARPARAWGMLPFVASLIGLLLATTVLDVVEGRAELLAESGHALEVLGLAFVWMLARLVRRPLTGTRLRLA